LIRASGCQSISFDRVVGREVGIMEAFYKRFDYVVVLAQLCNK
jgi:hypothetical protein